jgi:2-dehydro-3-deoxyphosphogluconate aldolase/(4S)-4-hydroxy-2-oxoglutarate aldolase
VLSVDQVKSAVDAGARFIVAPGFNPKVVDYCLENDICVVPGVNNPSQIERALERKLKVVKFFPAEASGGLAFLKAVAAPYSGILFLPTGGINLQNMMSYLSFSRVIACGGSWMVEDDLISGCKFSKITRRCREALTAVIDKFGQEEAIE